MKDPLLQASHSLNSLSSEHLAARVRSVDHSDLNLRSDPFREILELKRQDVHQDLSDLGVLLNHKPHNMSSLIFIDLNPRAEFLDLVALKDQDRYATMTQELSDHPVHLDQTNHVVPASLRSIASSSQRSEDLELHETLEVSLDSV